MSRTIEITEAQYNKLKAFGDDTVAHGFSMHYADVRHNCVDFTWDALNHAGIQRKHSLDVKNHRRPRRPIAARRPHSAGRPVTGQGRLSPPAQTSMAWTALNRPSPTANSNRTTTHPLPSAA